MRTSPGPLSRLRRSHEQKVLGLLRRHGPLSRAELGQRTTLSRTTLYDIVGTLVASGAIVTAPGSDGPRKRGRPVERLTLNPAAGQAVGIDFARRAVHVAAVNVAHEVIGAVSETHPPDLPWPRRVELAERLAVSLGDGTVRLSALGAVGGVGVGVVGPVGPPAGPGQQDGGAGSGGPHAALPPLLEKRFGAPVLLDNNTRLAALAEATWGVATGHQDVLYLRLSDGVGGGLVADGGLHRGVDGLSGELGHITADPGGRRCECGGTGCLETVASVGAVLDAYRSRGGTAPGMPAFLAAVAAGDPVAREVLAAAGGYVGTVLAAVCNAVGPSVIVLGGALTEAGEALFGPVRRALHAHLMPLMRDRISLRRAALGDAGGAYGGIALVLRESPLLAHYPGPDAGTGAGPADAKEDT